MAAIILYVAASLLGFALVQRRLAKTAITGPMIFVALGLLASASVLGIIETGSGDVTVDIVNVVFQGTLVLVLFTDASALHFDSWRKDAALPGRLLGIGLPLTIALGTIIAALLFTDLGIWEAAIIGAIIAPSRSSKSSERISTWQIRPRIDDRISAHRCSPGIVGSITDRRWFAASDSFRL